jgi:hypothetical protein
VLKNLQNHCPLRNLEASDRFVFWSEAFFLCGGRRQLKATKTGQTNLKILIVTRVYAEMGFDSLKHDTDHEVFITFPVN